MSLFSSLRDRLVISLGEFNGGPDEEFPLQPADKALGWMAAICFGIALLLVVR